MVFLLPTSPEKAAILIRLNNPQSFINSESQRIGFIGLPFAVSPHPMNQSGQFLRWQMP
jgi:hypothetical protein